MDSVVEKGWAEAVVVTVMAVDWAEAEDWAARGAAAAEQEAGRHQP